MDRRTNQALDNRACGVNTCSQKPVLHYCSFCGRSKTLQMFYELGGWFYTAEDGDRLNCSYCGTELKIAEASDD